MIAVVVVQQLIKQERYHDAMAVADTLSEHYPRFADAMVKKGTAAYYLLRTNFYDLYPTSQDVLKDQRSYLANLQRVKQSTFDGGASVGWRQAER